MCADRTLAMARQRPVIARHGAANDIKVTVIVACPQTNDSIECLSGHGAAPLLAEASGKVPGFKQIRSIDAEQEKSKAAVQIQSVMRQPVAKESVQRMIQERAAGVLQRSWRCSRDRFLHANHPRPRQRYVV